MATYFTSLRSWTTDNDMQLGTYKTSELQPQQWVTTLNGLLLLNY